MHIIINKIEIIFFFEKIINNNKKYNTQLGSNIQINYCDSHPKAKAS